MCLTVRYFHQIGQYPHRARRYAILDSVDRMPRDYGYQPIV